MVPIMQTKGSPEADPTSAAALGDAMFLCTSIPWAVCALLYSGLHITYRRDRVAAQAYQRARSGFSPSSLLLPTIVEEDAEEHDAEAALAAMGSRRMPLPTGGGIGPPRARIGELGRKFSRSA
jgi:hypothetical protein